MKFPSVTIEYQDVDVEVDALLNSASVPSLANVVLGGLKVPASTYSCHFGIPQQVVA